MPRLMSVAYTEDAVVERRKTVTRRKGWTFAKPGDRLTLCRKVMGRKKGEPLVRLAEVEIVSVRRERLSLILDQGSAYGPSEMVAEGFPGMDPVEFYTRYFVEEQGFQYGDVVTRIEWRYLDTPDQSPTCGRTAHHPHPHDLADGTTCPGLALPPVIPDPDQRRALADTTRKEIRR